MNNPIREDIKNEYNNLVKNVEKLKKDVNELDNYVNTMSEKSVSSETIVTETPIETIPEPVTPVTETIPEPVTPVTETIPEPVTPVTETTPQPVTPVTETTPQPVPEEIIEKKEEQKEELLDALTVTNQQETKTDEQLLQEQKHEMNARKTNIEEALKKMVQYKKNEEISNDKIVAWNLLGKTNIKLEEYLSTTLFYDMKRDWVTYGQQLWYRPEHYLKEFLDSYHELNVKIGINKYYKDIMSKYIKNDVNDPVNRYDQLFINIKTQLDDTYNGIIQMKKKGGRKTKKQRKQKKQRKSKRKQRKSNRIK
jgi:hypothetical protein